MERLPRPVLLVGSVPLATARDVFCTAARILGPALRALPDGETGERANWIAWQRPRLASSEGLVLAKLPAGAYAAQEALCLAPGARARDIRLVPLGYAEAAITSYRTFSELKHVGSVGAEVRFQVSLPTPIALLAYFDRAIQAIVFPLLEASLRADLEAIASVVPHDELAIQWDVAIEFAALELGLPMPFDDVEASIIGELVRIGDAVPAGVELGYHFCYGDAGHKHFKEPADMALLAKIANALAGDSNRTIHWIHMPVPRSRTDDAYYAALDNLRLAPSTTLYLGLVHQTDGAEGTKRRIAAATEHCRAFGIATECGMGRRQPASIEALLELHRALINA
jgi:hypothetical protein